jgi:hypothetical protein
MRRCKQYTLYLRRLENVGEGCLFNLRDSCSFTVENVNVVSSVLNDYGRPIAKLNETAFCWMPYVS